MATLNTRLEKQAYYLYTLALKRKARVQKAYKKQRREQLIFLKIKRNNRNFT